MRRKAVIWAAVALIVVAGAVLIVLKVYPRGTSIDGVTLIEDPDVKRQAPIPDVMITAVAGKSIAHAKSGTSGAFHLSLPRDVWRTETIELQFRHSGYRALDVRQELRTRIWVIRMTPVSKIFVESSASKTTLKEVRVRYASKANTPINVGSVAKTFEVANTGDVPCERRAPCSPDGKWKAADGGLTLDAGESHEFQNLRTSCIAGPCPFTSIESNQSLQGGRVIKISVRNWSDTVTFLVEAEVVQTMFTDFVRNAYPAIFGREMSFTLPPLSEGPSIEADTNGTDIVYPLGPELLLSWAVCSLQVGGDGTKLYRCELKPGYEFE